MHKYVITPSGQDKRFFIENKRDWLYSRGGRSVAELLRDEKGFYVWMSAGKGESKKVYLPEDLPS